MPVCPSAVLSARHYARLVLGGECFVTIPQDIVVCIVFFVVLGGECSVTMPQNAFESFEIYSGMRYGGEISLFRGDFGHGPGTKEGATHPNCLNFARPCCMRKEVKNTDGYG